MSSLQELNEALKLADSAANDPNNPNKDEALKDARKLAKMISGKSRRPGAWEGASQGIKEGMADTLGFIAEVPSIPGRLVIKSYNLAAENIGLPEIREPQLAMTAFKNWMKEKGVTKDIPLGEQTSEYKTGYYGAQIVGAAMPIGAAGGAASRTQLATDLSKQAVGKFQQVIQPALQNMARNRERIMAGEAIGTTGAAQGAMLAEAMMPDNDVARFFSEIAGGLANPARGAYKLGEKSVGGLKELFRSWTKAGKEEQAADIIGKLIAETGDDPEVIKRMLLQSEPGDVKLTSGMKTGNPALLAMEHRLAQDNVKFQNLSLDISKNAMASLRGTVDNFLSTGDPQALSYAATLRSKYFDDLISKRLMVAKRDALGKSSAIKTKGAISEIGQETHAVLSTALKDLRGIESSLWNDIPRDINVVPSNTKAAMKNIKESLLKEESFPYAKTVKRMAKESTTTGELLKLRNRALDKARDARGQSDFSSARLFDMLAEGAREDIASLGLEEVEKATSFSSSLHSNFMSTFAGTSLQKKGSGAPRMAPETLLDEAFKGQGIKANLRMREMVKAGDFTDEMLSVHTNPKEMLLGDSVRNQEERFLRLVAENTMVDGVVDSSKLSNFMGRNQELLSKFPQLSGQLQTAGKATDNLNKILSYNQAASKGIKSKAAFSQLIESENPTLVVKKVLDGANPMSEYGRIANLAKRGGPGAIEGLKTSTYDYAVSKSTGANGVSFIKLRDTLRNAPSKGAASINDIMTNNKLINQEEMGRMNKLLDRAADIELAINSKRQAGELLDPPGDAFDFMVRTVGASLGGATPVAHGSGASLVAASAGSRIFRKLFENLPATRFVDVLIEASESPQLMARLMAKVKTPKQELEVAREIHSYLYAAGIIGLTEELEGGRDGDRPIQTVSGPVRDPAEVMASMLDR